VATIPITLPAPGNPAGLQVVVGEPVETPTQRNPAGDLLVAVVAANASNTLFGLYSNNSVVPPYQWQQIGAIHSNETISALASVSGDRVLVGTGQGKIYAFDTATGASTGQSIKLPKPSPSTHMAGGALLRIVSFDSGSIFAVLLGATETRDDGTQFLGSPAVQRYILGLPNELIYGFVAVDAPNTEVLRGLLAATDDAVYISRDDGQNWRRASQGLPVRPHCSDLRFALDRLGEANIVLGTFGRSMWMAHLG
jgi:outer membrane protein assembly factor BamB